MKGKVDLKQGDSINVNLEILRLISEGMLYREISEDLKKRGITPNSLSIIDKKLKVMVKEMKCKTVHQMMYKIGTMKLLEKGNATT